MRPETDVELVRRSAIAPLVEADGTYRNYPVFPFDSSRGFEMYSIELDPGARLDAETASRWNAGVHYGFFRHAGRTAQRPALGVGDGDSIRFKADRKHAYANEGNTPCRLSMVICYPS